MKIQTVRIPATIVVDLVLKENESLEDASVALQLWHILEFVESDHVVEQINGCDVSIIATSYEVP